LVELLRDYKAEQDKKKAAFGSDWLDMGMIFTGQKGGFHRESSLNCKYKRLAQKIGLPKETHIHSLRHTAASLLIIADIPAKVISDQLGHVNTGITQNLYAHVFASSKVKAMQAS